MAKKRLFGDKAEPCCETCTYGKLSADSSVVLCRRGGVMPLHHSCRHFHYDPLKRTPRRQKPLDAFDAAAFSLSGLSDDDTAVKASSSPEDSEMLSRLHAYLNDTSAPNAQAILNILAVEPAPENKEAPDASAESVSAPTSRTVMPNAPRATPESIPAPLVPDNTPDIFEDLKKLQIDASASSTKAAFKPFSLALGENIEDDDEPADDLGPLSNGILSLSDEDEDDDDDVLEADDLILTSLGDPDADEEVETLEINADGSVTTTTKKIGDLTDS